MSTGDCLALGARIHIKIDPSFVITHPASLEDVPVLKSGPVCGLLAPGEKISQDVFLIEVFIGDLEIEWGRGMRKELEGILR